MILITIIITLYADPFFLLVFVSTLQLNISRMQGQYLLECALPFSPFPVAEMRYRRSRTIKHRINGTICPSDISMFKGTVPFRWLLLIKLLHISIHTPTHAVHPIYAYLSMKSVPRGFFYQNRILSLWIEPGLQACYNFFLYFNWCTTTQEKHRRHWRFCFVMRIISCIFPTPFEDDKNWSLCHW